MQPKRIKLVIKRKVKTPEYRIDTIQDELSPAPCFLSLQEAADILKVSYRTIYRLIQLGEIDACKVKGVWRIPKIALMQYLESRHILNMDF